MRTTAIVAAVCVTTSLPLSADEPIGWPDPEFFDEIEAKVSGSEARIKVSLPELRYAKRFGLFPWASVDKVGLEGADARGFQVQVINLRALSIPGTDFALAYLLDAKGKIVDWKSQWLYNRRGNLVTKLADVNNDGTEEFCFVCEHFEVEDKILAAFSLEAQRLKTVTAEPVSTFTVEFTETALPDGIVLRPQLKGELQWKTGKLYEIPVRVLNNGEEPIGLQDCSIWLSGLFPGGGGTHGNIAVHELKPNEAVNSVITARFTEAPSEKQFGFKIHKNRKIPNKAQK